MRKSGVIATVVGLSLAGLIVACNLDSAAFWFLEQDCLLESMYCFQMQTAVSGLVGFKDFRMVKAWSGLASCYSKLGRFKQAIYADKKAVAILKATRHNPQILCMMQAEVAGYMIKDKDYAAAEQQLNEALAEAEKQNSPSDYTRGYILNVLLDAYLAQKKFPEAEVIASLLIPIDDQLQAQSPTYSLGARNKLVEVYCRTKKFADAERIAKEAIDSTQNAPGPLSKARAHDCLARVYLAEGNSESASKEFDLAVTEVESAYGKSDRKVELWRSHYKHLLEEKNPYPDPV